ncbi:MAG: DUF1285 domain-containing protein [Alphaproteobacteria bacterium]|nr:DUF1285 domain-containing protein [Alphaproteobacteria bacterium]
MKNEDAAKEAAELAKKFGASAESADARGHPDGPRLCGDLDMRIGRDGTWFYHGSPIGRNRLVKLFARVLRRDSEGVYWLETPAEKGRIEVDDAPFVAVELTVSGVGEGQGLRFRTNLDDVLTADADHPIHVTFDQETGEPSPYIHVRDGLDALIARPVYYELVALGEEETVEGERLYGVWSEGHFFALGTPET